MLKPVKISAFVVFSSFLIVSCEKKSVEVHQHPEKVHLVMAEVNPEDSITGQMDYAFKKRLEELSEGNMTVDIHYYGILGDEAKVMKILESENDNSIQLARVSANLSNYGAKKSALISVPYIFKDDSHFWRFAGSKAAEEILLEPYDLGMGVRGLCFAQDGFKHLFSTEAVYSLEDLKGKKIRVSDESLKMVSIALDTVPVNVQYADLYMSLQNGKVELAEQSLSNYLSNSFYKFAPYMIMDGHGVGAVEIVISSKCWDSLSYYQQVLIKKAADYASKYCKGIVNEQETNDAIELITKGITLVEVADKSEWQDACKNIIQESTKDYEKLYSDILDLAY